MSFVAGHPQIFVYTMLLASAYVLTLSRSAVNGWKPYCIHYTIMVAVGGALAAVQILPMLELASLSVRSGKSYELFSGYTLPLAQLPQLLFPALFGVSAPSAAGVLEETSVGVSYFGAFNFHELTGYVGLLTCMLATLGFVQSRREKIVIFWAAPTSTCSG